RKRSRGSGCPRRPTRAPLHRGRWSDRATRRLPAMHRTCLWPLLPRRDATKLCKDAPARPVNGPFPHSTKKAALEGGFPFRVRADYLLDTAAAAARATLAALAFWA